MRAQVQTLTFQGPPKPGGQKLRPKLGAWERGTNAQQRKLVRVFDLWVTWLRPQLQAAALRGEPVTVLRDMLHASTPPLRDALIDAVQQGNSRAVGLVAGRQPPPGVARLLISRNIESRTLVAESLVPHIERSITAKLVAGAAQDAKLLREAFIASRSAPAAYAGGYWTMIFETPRELGKGRAAMTGVQERILWKLDPTAEHCVESPGFYGCPDLAGEYDGWQSLKSVPAGLVSCRGNCVLPQNIVSAAPTLAMKSFYSGPALEVVVRGGRRLAITPNHPILTEQGFVPAHLLHEGDNVVCGPLGQEMVLGIDEYHDYIPARIEQVWEALRSSVPVIQGRRDGAMPSRGFDFYGDGRFIDGDVEIIAPHGLLRRDVGDVSLYQPISEQTFHRGDLGSVALPGQSLQVYTGFAGFNAQGGSMTGGDLSLSFIRGHSSPFDSRGFALAPGQNALLDKPTPESGPTPTELLCDAILGLPGPITVEPVLQIREFQFSGHVYDLQTTPGVYIGSGIVVHNCRCTLLLWRDGEWRRGL